MSYPEAYLYIISRADSGTGAPHADLVVTHDDFDLIRDRMFILQLAAQARAERGSLQREPWIYYRELMELDYRDELTIERVPLATLTVNYRVTHNERYWAQETLKH